jgi:hypothetical protein
MIVDHGIRGHQLDRTLQLLDRLVVFAEAEYTRPRLSAI